VLWFMIWELGCGGGEGGGKGRVASRKERWCWLRRV
jgi:hypothetical protein